MELNEFSDKALAKYSKVIMDAVFESIQNDKVLMHDYLRTVEEKGLDVTNRHIGKAVKTRFKLKNDEQRTENPKSTLIQSHQQFQ